MMQKKCLKIIPETLFNMDKILFHYHFLHFVSGFYDV